MRQTQKRICTMASLLVLVALVTVTALAQADSIVGKYKGTVKTAGSPDGEVTLELVKTGDKITGQAMHGDAKVEVTEVTFSEGKWTLKFGPAAQHGTLIARIDGDLLTGEWSNGGPQKRTVELKRVSEGATTAMVNLNGQWDGMADAQGQPFPFVLTLKIDGEKVSGSSSSQLGEAQISSGTWKDGKLNFQLEGGSGVITMSAVVIDGKLSGDFDYAGQAQGKWSAVRKN